MNKLFMIILLSLFCFGGVIKTPEQKCRKFIVNGDKALAQSETRELRGGTSNLPMIALANYKRYELCVKLYKIINKNGE